MSWKVTEEVVEHSRARYGTRTFMLILAETAHHDGVVFMTQAPSKGRAGLNESLMERARLSDRQIRRCIRNAERLDELEVRSYRRGRNEFAIYRIVVGRLRDVGADHERLRERYGIELDRPFSSPAELLLPRAEREQLATGQFVRSSHDREADNMSGRRGGDGRTSATSPADISDGDGRTSATALRARAGELPRSNGTVQNSPSTSSSINTIEEDVPAAGGGVDGNDLVDQLLRTFAEAVGRWPEDRSEWGGWRKAFGELAAREVQPDELRLALGSYQRYWRERRAREAKVAGLGPGETGEWVNAEAEASPFALTKYWLVLNAALADSFFAVARWVYDVSWRIDEDEVAWVIDNARVTETERAKLRVQADEVRRAHADPQAELLRWVELHGWALDEIEWRKGLIERLPARGTDRPVMRKAANDRRLELRAELGRLRFGLDKPARDTAAA